MRRTPSITLASAGVGTLMGIAVALAATEHQVIQTAKSFRPGEIAVRAGDTIAFVNDDFYDHNVYSETTGSAFNIGIQAPGETTHVTLESPGTVEVLCRIHPKMRLLVTVSE